MSNLFRKAERRRARLRCALDGPSGSGKTLGALMLAYGLTGDWSKIAVIDTERGSGELYAGAKIPGTNDVIGQYSVLTLTAPYSPDRYVQAIKAAEAEGFEAGIIDSLSHAWEGDGGCLDMADRSAAASRSGNRFTAWRDVTPKHNALVDAMLTSGMHVVATMRTKTEYVIEEDERGKKVPRKVGMAPRQRDGMEYEFTVVLDISPEHVASASKDRTGLLDGNPHKLSVETGRKLRAWLESGAEPAAVPADNTRLGGAPAAGETSVALAENARLGCAPAVGEALDGDPEDCAKALAILRMTDTAAVLARSDEVHASPKGEASAPEEAALTAMVELGACKDMTDLKSFAVGEAKNHKAILATYGLDGVWADACKKYAARVKAAGSQEVAA